VKVLRTIAALTLLAAWLPATSHCLLGAVELMDDSCCEAHGHEGEPARGEDDCESCSNVESGNYKLSAPNVLIFAFHATLAWDLQLPAPTSVNLTATRPDSGRAPPDLVVRWQFLTRAAIPGRAPARIL
jgi:hypothetical protein